MSKLRKMARGRECQVRIGGVCNGNSETTVLAHLNGGGMGTKRHDLIGCWACSACHDVIDGRKKSNIPREQLNLWHLEAVIRTQEVLLREGLIRV